MRSIQVNINRKTEEDPYEGVPYMAVSQGPNGSTVYTGPAGVVASAFGFRAAHRPIMSTFFRGVRPEVL